jgi:DNA helicase-2/ATP-dependent DNA helicase PcrA
MQNENISIEQFQKYYNNLNPEQKAAVDAIEGPVMTIAGAGTGKTQILAVRIAKILLETQIDPYNILCLTFTEAGVTAMRKRLMEIIGPAAYHVKVATFHSFCNEIIRENTEEFNLGRDHEQIDDLEKILLMQEIIDELGVKSPLRPTGEAYHYLNDIDKRIKDLKKENITPDTFKTTLSEIHDFLEKLQPLIINFCNTKGRPSEEQISAVHPDKILPHFQNQTKLQQAYLSYFQELYKNFEQALDGSKKNDGPKRTAFRNALNAFLKKLINDLPKQLDLAKAYQAYQQKMGERKRYDYEDMILLVSQKFAHDQAKSDGGLLRKYQERYQYILVDEYQDTNSAQNSTVNLLGSFFDTPNIFVVGDDDQSIYRFQGASVENIIEFHDKHQSELKIVTLIKNYRSQQSILDAAGALISHNQTRLATKIPGIDKRLFSQTPAPAAPLNLTIYESEDAENYGIAKAIQKLISEGVEPTEIAILYRNHYQSADLIEILQKLGIPYQIIAGRNILEDLKIDQLIKLFRLIDQPNDNDLLAQVLFLNFFQFSRLDIIKLTHYYFTERLEKQGYSLFQIINLRQHLEKARLENIQLFIDFSQKILEWKDLSMNETLSHFFETVIKTSGYLENLIEQKTRLEGLNRLNTLFQEIKKQNRRNHAMTISEFLEQLKVRSQNQLKLLENPLVGERHGIQLMTAHGSKGLEFQHVFMIRTTHSTWDKPGRADSLKLPAGLITNEITDEKLAFEEDQRRLFYVALTRAKLMSHLSYARFRSEQNKIREDLPTLFLKEIPENLINTIEQPGHSAQDLTELETLFLIEAEPNFTLDEENFLKSLVSQFIMSPTGLNNYLTCPRKFYYQNLIRLPQAKSKSAAMGTAIHAALESYFREYHRKKIKPPKELLTLHFKSSLEKELLTNKDYLERLEIGQNILNEYYETYNEQFTSNTISEFNFSHDGVNIEGIQLTGKIDKIEITENNIIVTDFKTGNADTGMQKLAHGEDYWRQLVFYKILCDRSPKFKRDFQGRPMGTAKIEFLEKSKQKKTFLHPTIKIKPEDENEVIENIKIANQQIQNLNFEKIEKSSPCDKCPFHGICWKN